MNDALRSKIEIALTAALAFAGGLFLAAELDLTPRSMAAVQEADLTMGAGDDQLQRLEELSFEKGFAPVVEEVSGAVVTIEVEKPVQRRRARPFPFPRRPEREEQEEPPTRPGTGSGYIVDAEGYIVTNNHVVREARDITVVLADRREIDDVEVVGRDPQTDVALLKIDAPNLSSVPLGDSGELSVGEWVLAVGSPGFESMGGDPQVLRSTVTAGIVSAKGRSINILGQEMIEQGRPNLAIEDFIQTDAVINRGNSGGPLVNTRGEVVGMSTAILSETGAYQGYGFAVPTKLIRQVVEDLMRYGEVRRAVLGVTISPVDATLSEYLELSEVRGVQIQDFSPLASGRSPAREAGVERGDVVLAVDGDRIVSVPDLQSKIRGYEPGETVTLRIARRSGDQVRRLEVDVELGAADTGQRQARARDGAEDAGNPLGVEVEPIPSELRSELELPDGIRGVVITDAPPGSPLRSAAGLSEAAWRQTAILITEVDGEPITGVESYREAVAGLEPGGVHRIQLYVANPDGQGQYSYVTMEIPEG